MQVAFLTTQPETFAISVEVWLEYYSYIWKKIVKEIIFSKCSLVYIQSVLTYLPEMFRQGSRIYHPESQNNHVNSFSHEKKNSQNDLLDT